MVSSTRCASALYMGRPVVAEPHPYSMPWRDIVSFSSSVEEFYLDATKALDDWRALHRWQLERFERLLPPSFCIGDPLRRIGIT
jgi:hypothetical protein